MNRNRFKNLVIHNAGLKLLSLAIAVAFYVAIASQPVAEVGLLVPLEYRDIPAGLEIATQSVAQVHVRLRGPADLISRTSRSDVVAYISLRDARPGIRHYDLATSGAVHAPYGLTIVDLWPAQFDIDLQQADTRVVPVKVRLIGRPTPGYAIGGFTVSPSEVRIIGPSSHLAEAGDVFTDPVDVTGLASASSLKTTVRTTDPELRILGNDSAIVHVVISRAAK
jgi:YbbR domain-containing protein